MKITATLKKELTQWLDTYWTTYINGDIETWSKFIRDDYRNIGGTKEEIWNSKQEIIDYTHSIMDQMVGTVEIRNREIDLIPYGEYMMVNEFTDIYVKIEGEWMFYGPFRMSSLLEKTDTGWIALHQHGSYPDMKAMKGEAFSVDTVKAENAKLLEAVKSRTLELEIEASLERVRTVAMGMKKPEDMLDVCRVISEQLQNFEVENIRNVQTAIIDESIGQYLCYQYFTPYGKNVVEKTEYLKSPVEHEMVKQMLASRDGHFIGSITGEELKEFRTHRKKENHFSDPLLDKASELSYCFLSIGEGGLGLSLYQTLADDVMNLFQRFHQVFSLAFQRFRDIQKAEAQAREVKIQLALERVRARTMAMQHSDELMETSELMFEQIKNLGIELWSCGFSLWYDDDGYFLGYNPGPEGKMGTPLRIPLTEDIFFTTIREAKRRGDDFFVFESEGESLVETYRYMDGLPVVGETMRGFVEAGFPLPTYQVTHCGFFSNGHLMFITQEPNPDAVDIFKRFTKVFNQTYTRFLDLQKAEEQAREAKIEAALERVRSISLAMHHTDELQSVIHSVHQELLKLKLSISGGSFIAINSEIDTEIHCWGSGGTADTSNEVHIPRYDKPFYTHLLKGIKKGPGFFTEEYTQEDKIEFFKFLFQHEPWSKLSAKEKKKTLSAPGGYTRSCTVSKHTSIFIINHFGEKFSEADNDILKRFGKVFEQSYTRFLDLQKAEAQAREAQVNLAVERVRARALAMFKSEEILHVVNKLKDEIMGLDIPNVAAATIHLKEQDGMCRVWDLTSLELEDEVLHLPLDIRFRLEDTHPDFFMRRVWESDEEYFVVVQEESDFKHTIQWLRDNGLNVQADETEEFFESTQLKKVYHPTVPLNNGRMCIDLLDTPTLEVESILKKMAGAFDLAYKRFEDLKKAEAQTREARIEAALERVRSRSMAMHSSDEFVDASDVMVNQLKELGIETLRIGIGIINKENDSTEIWSKSEIENKVKNTIVGVVPRGLHPIFDNMVDAWKEKKPFFSSERIGDEVKEYYEKLDSFLSYPKRTEFNERETMTAFFFNHGSLNVISLEPLKEEECNIMIRFAKVFGQIFQRFLDLKKAEEQTKEAQIELSLERIRAHVTAMQESSDLLDIVVTMRTEFVKLGHEAHYFWHMRWLPDRYDKAMTSGDGTRIGMVMTLPRHIHGDIPLVADWEKSDKPTVVLAMEAETAVEYVHKMITLGDFEQVDPQAPTLDDIRHIGGLTFVMARTTHGEIGFSLPGAVTNPSKDAVDTLVRFAGVFDLAYKRFEDLKAAERQHREAKIELALERVRARTMAMQRSTELNEVASVLFEQIRNLEGALWGTGFALCNVSECQDEFWFANEAGVMPPVKIPNTEDDVHIAMLKGWTEKREYLLFQKEGDALASHYKYLNSLPQVKAFFEPMLDAGHQFPTWQQWHAAYFSQGYLLIITVEPYPEPEIFKRFAKVFDQTYTRFLDLQKAEAQAREAEIQLALERVRAKTMAMKTQSDLLDIIELFGEQLNAVGIRFDNVTFIEGPITKKRDWDLWSYAPEAENTTDKILIPYIETPYFTKTAKAVKEYQKTGQPIQVKTFTKKEKNEFLDHYWKHAPAVSDEFVNYVNATPGSVIVDSFLEEITVSMVKWNTEPYTDEELEIFERFAKEFRQTYIRFLDIKKAEAQAREALIEASLERIRAKAMAMHHSDELDEVLAVLCEQFDTLGIFPMSTHMTVLDIEHNKFTFRETGKFGNRSFGEQTVALDAMDTWKDMVKSWKSAEPYSINRLHFPKETLPQVWEVFHESFASMPEGSKITPDDYPDGIYHTAGKHPFGYIGMNQVRPATEKEEQIVIKFANEFGRAYQRFLDLQKAEAQAREAQIVASLERVRAATMAMHNSSELSSVLSTLFEQFDILGIHPSHAVLTLINKEKNTLNFRTTGINGYKVFAEQEVDLTVVDSWLDTAEKWKKSTPNAVNVNEYPPEVLPEVWEVYRDIISAIPENARPKIKDFPEGLFITEGYCKFGYIGFAHHRKPTYEEKDIVRRIAVEFGTLYQRFLDLQKAEAQAKEAQIEAALERVRSRTMAMHKSEELLDVITVVSEQLQYLNFKFDTVSFGNNNQEHDYRFWFAIIGDPKPIYIQVPYLKNPMFDRLKKVLAQGLEFHTDTLTPEESREWHEHVFIHAEMPSLTEVTKAYILGSGYARSIAIKPSIMLIVSNYAGKPYTNNENEIIKRFATVFEQSYTRFLDLKKAEAQAREAKIEAALEKVRSRTMGMQSSDELPEVANLLFLEVQGLGIPAWSCGYNILEEDKKSANAWMSSEGVLQEPFKLRLYGEASFDDMGNFVLSNDTMLVQELGDKAIEEHYKYMKSFPDLQPTFKYFEEKGLSLPTYQINHLCKFGHGFLLFITYEPVPDAHGIFKRFTSVFDQTYTRFLDLKKAEAQTREAQIENALEKVLSRSLAMQDPEELTEVAQLLREEMGNLGVEELETSSIYIQDESSGLTQCWFNIKNSDNPGKTVTDQMTIDLQDTWVGRKMYEFYRSSEKQTSILMQGEQRIEWIRYCEEKSDLFTSTGFYGETIPERTYHLHKFSNGYIGAAAPGEISKESWELLKRATAVFSFAYTRFRDLQMAEASARASMRQASLDRVRADISSMRNADDLDRITPLVFNELTTLGIPFIRCGVFIVHEKQKNVEVYLSTPEGKSLAVMTLPFDANEMTTRSVESWKKEEVYVQHWDQSDFVNWSISLQEQGHVKDLKTYQDTEAAPESLHLHFIPFRQGLLYVGSIEKLGEEQIELVKALARSFAIAYARFEDFVKLEQAKAEVESAMSELKATQSQLVQQEKLASLGQLTAGIAHEIKNPLNFVNNFSEVSIELIDEALEEIVKTQHAASPINQYNGLDEIIAILDDVQSNLHKIHQHGTRANGIVTSMLQHSRGGTGKMEPTDLNALIKEYVNLSYHGMRAGKNPISVEIALDLDPDLREVSLIKEDFTRVVINLCNNAFDAMRSVDSQHSANLCVRTKKYENHILIEVEDNGPGIPNEIKDKILQPFFTTKKGTEGTGLGLSITHDIVKAHGGELKVESEEGKGSEFIIKLPIS